MKMEDIARMAEVSKSAVSIALSGKSGISEKTREKILRIVKETGYLPRSMVKAEQVYGVSNTLRFIAFTNSGIVLEQYSKQPFFMELLAFLEEKCRSLGYSLMYSAIDMQYFDRDIDKFLNDGGANGVILLGTNLNRGQIRRAAQVQPNLVVLDTCFETDDVNFILMNNMKGAYDAGMYLLGLGHRSIGYVQSQVRMHNFDRRKQGFLAALEEYGLQADESYFFTVSPTFLGPQDEFKRQIQVRLERKEPLPTALFCECDYIAISVIKSLAEIGVRVPEDISVVGFDNIAESTIVSPELTTIHVEKEKIASLAVEKLIDLIDNKDQVKTKIVVDTKLVERQSCRSLQEK
ncbi:LacI family DNA-binding transcriptional regulator [Paenibacillus alkalitolerans]|uniref:LacI family DNA-binding transcriptional regulator n=1 Tax=Paenibacillus alkalitolerans TaxID=2799335 RepID=UPI0018F570D2|nr:LacI family DNA-binding transcriptional regulator [Paenibacillus alkalitolerans]